MTAGNARARAAVWFGSAPLIKGGAKPNLNQPPPIRLRGLVSQYHCKTAKPNKGNRSMGVRR